MLRRRLGSFGAKDVDKYQTLDALNQEIASRGDEPYIGDLIRQYWNIRKQLGFIKD